MTPTQRAAVEYFDLVSKQRGREPAIESALKLYRDLTAKWQREGYDFSFESAGYSSMHWFRTWDLGGQKGGLNSFRAGLHRCLRFSLYKLVHRSTKTVWGFDSLGQPLFRPGMRGQKPDLTKDEAQRICKRLNAEQKESKGCYRFTVWTAKDRDWQGLYKIRRREIELVLPFDMISLESLHNSIGVDTDGELVGVDRYEDSRLHNWIF